MPGFTNTKYNNTVEAIVTTMKDKITSNPNYKFSDKAPTEVEYYNINKYKTTLDEAAKITLSEISSNSGIKWNKINNFLLYGIDNVQLTATIEEFGLQTQEIEGECYVLPGTITPYAGDFFLIKYVDQKVIFEVTDVSPDTLEHGSNIYRLQYRSSSVSYEDENIESITEDDYRFIVDNVGTNYNSIIKSEVSVFIEHISDYIERLQEFYKNVFYSNRVQAFVYTYLNNDHFYDPYMIEFIISNHLMDSMDDSNYLYICHQTKLDNTFSLKYAKTFFHALENRDVSRIDHYAISGAGVAIQDHTTTFYNRVEDYYQIFCDRTTTELLQQIPCFRSEIVDAIKSNKVFRMNKELVIYNIIIKFFNNQEIIQDDLDTLFDIIDDLDSITLFYAIPCIIYCLNNQILTLLNKTK